MSAAGGRGCHTHAEPDGIMLDTCAACNQAARCWFNFDERILQFNSLQMAAIASRLLKPSVLHKRPPHKVLKCRVGLPVLSVH